MHEEGDEIRDPTQGMFDLLVKNAIDFLERAIAEIEVRPKYSIINFFAAVELFFKARLMTEHWSLVIVRPDHANLSKFRDGDLPSVTLDQAIERLKNISGENFSERELKTFDTLRKHRNKLVHFFHPAYVENPDAVTLEVAVVELCKGWWFLHRMLKGRWAEWFYEYEEKFDELASNVNRLKQFLKAKHDVLRPEIEEEIRKGQLYTVCRFCDFPAAKVDRSESPLVQTNCRVCGWVTNRLIIPCPNCSEQIDVEDGSGTCGSCDTAVDLDDLIEEFGVHDDQGDPKEALEKEEVHAYCPECEYSEEPTVVPFHDEWLCLNCQSLFSTADFCGWCNTLVAGIDSNDTYLAGCRWCEGLVGYRRDE